MQRAYLQSQLEESNEVCTVLTYTISVYPVRTRQSRWLIMWFELKMEKGTQ